MVVLLVLLWVRSYSKTIDPAYRGKWPSDWRINGVKKNTRLGDEAALLDSKNRKWTANSTRGAILFSVTGDDTTKFAQRQVLGLGYLQDGMSTSVRIPFTFPVVVAATAALGPWLPRRFNLRMLLIATTLVGVVLGFIVWSAS